MSNDLRDPAQLHIDAVYRLNDYLIETSADRFGPEMHQHIQRVLRSFEKFCGTKPPHPYPRDGLYDDSLGRNYITAQCSALLVFANAVETYAERHPDEELRSLITGLHGELKSKYDMFFS